ncbi:MAG: Clp protease ClpP [Rhodocyclaceae bacterium]|nr:Clp protease ClpP [Rhodocyclaceae bacterium]
MPNPTEQTAAKWYEIKAQGDAAAAGARAAEIYIYGDIGNRWDENGVIAADLVRELAALDVDAIILRINSYGGSVPDGLAIFNALKRHKASVDVQVDGVAISCAGYIAMAGDTVTMAANAMLMIHAPWGMAIGNSAELRDQADMLDKYAAAMATSYATKSGKSRDECMALLTDGKDHWYTADEAQAESFCDSVGPAVNVAASIARSYDLSRFSTPVAAATNHQEHTMPEVNPAATAAAPFSRTKEQSADILAFFKPFASREGVADLQTQVLADPAVTVEAASSRLLTHLAKDTAPAVPAGAFPVIETLADEADKMRGAQVQALLARAGVRDAKGETIRVDASNPFRGHKLLDLARASLGRAGINTEGMTQMEVVAAGFTQSGSDFPVLLENTMHKALQAAYATVALTWNRFCAIGSVSDFRAHSRYRVGSLSNLDAVSELGEFKNKTIPDGEKSSITAATKGNIINLSRQAVINDDLGAFVGLAASFGRASARTIESDVYAMLALNSGMGPLMGDGKALFHVDHGNIAIDGAWAVTILESMRTKMAMQKDVGDNDYLDLRPAVALCSIGDGGTLRVINNSEYDPDTANKLQRPNMVRGLFRDVVDTPRLAAGRGYAFADPGEAPVIEVAFLDGAQEPYLEIKDGFEVDGASYKVRLDFGIAAIDYRGAVTAKGTA